MNVAPDQTISLQIFLDHKSLSSMDQKILMRLPLPNPDPFFDLSRSLEVVWMSSESYLSSFVFLSFCLFSLFVFLAKFIVHICSYKFIIVHWNSGMSWVLSYCLSVFSSFCPDLSLITCLCSCLFILVHRNLFARANSTSMLHLIKIPIDGAHVRDICCIS